MLGKITPLAFAVSLLCLAACGGGSGGNHTADTPQTSPTNEEKVRLEASKVYTERLATNRNHLARVYTVGNNVLVHDHKNNDNQWFTSSDFRSLPQGLATLAGKYQRGALQVDTVIRSYQGFRSGVVNIHKAADSIRAEHTHIYDTYGAWTSPDGIPASGKATYNGIAFDQHEEGTLTYHVDFTNRKGMGEINGISRYGKITLHEAPFRSVQKVSRDNSIVTGVDFGQASAEQGPGFMGYSFTFAGNQAQEIVGNAVSSKHLAVGFHGTRGEIKE